MSDLFFKRYLCSFADLKPALMILLRILRLWVFASVFLMSLISSGQSDSLPTQVIPLITVSATQIETAVSAAPLSLSVYQARPIQQSRQQLSLQEYLHDVPGLFSLNANNTAQDLRISIRGFGARAAFGIRGITLLVDGIPETTPDGQGQLDNLNLGIIDRIEVIRGPSSALYGNAAGGVISIQTLGPPDSSYLQAGLTLGAYQFQQYQFRGAIKGKKTHYILQGSYTRSDGYREHSGFETTNFNLRAFHRFSEQSELKIQFNYANSPKGEDPGGINQEAVDEDRQQARDRNVIFNAGEAIRQWKAGLHFSHRFSDEVKAESYAFYAGRDFVGRLPFETGGLINLDRGYWGQGASLSMRQWLAEGKNELRVGYQLALQNDERKRFENLEGVGGRPLLNQRESFYAAGLYLVDHLQLGKWLFNAGLRFDWNRLKAADRFMVDGDDSGEIKLTSFNPSLGLSYRLDISHFLFANFSSSFETPALSELSANPSGGQGFNENLNAQRAYNYEIGFKSQVSDYLSMQLAVYYVSTKEDLVPFELEAFPGRRFFRNAGSSERRGLELAANYTFASNWTLSSTYTFSDFTYKTFLIPGNDFSGQDLPGIPQHMGSLTLSYEQSGGLHFQLQSRFIGRMYADDGNSEEVEDYVLLNINAGYQMRLGQFNMIPFLGINNLLNTAYPDNIRINAFGRRYYEPGPPIHIYGGFRIRF